MGAGPSAESLGGVDTGVASADGAQQAAQIQLSDEARSMFAQKLVEAKEKELMDSIMLNYGRIKDVERELAQLQLQLRLASGPQKAALELLRKKIEYQGDKVTSLRQRYIQTKQLLEKLGAELASEEAMKDDLCNELNVLVQEAATAQLAKIEQLRAHMETLGLAGPRTASAHSTAQAAGISAQAVAAAQLGLPKLAVHHSAAITAATLLSSSTPGADQGPQASAVPAAASAAASNPASTSSRAESTGMHTSGPAPAHAQYPPVQGAGQHAQSSQQAPGSAADEHGARQDAAAHAAAEAAAEAERQRQREVADAARSRHVMLGAGSATKGSRRANQPAAHSQGAPSQQHTVELQQPEEHSAATGSSSSQAAGQLGAVNAADSMAGPPRRPRAGAGGVGGGRGSAGPGGSGNAVAAATMGRGGGFAGFDL